MRTILLFLFGAFIACTSFSLFAECQYTDMTKPDYCISLGNMDSMSGSHSEQGTYSGRGALYIVLQKISGVLLFIIPILAIISFLIAGYYYIFSAGESEKATQAKNIIKWNIIAMAVAFFSWAIINLIASLFR